MSGTEQVQAQSTPAPSAAAPAAPQAGNVTRDELASLFAAEIAAESAPPAAAKAEPEAAVEEPQDEAPVEASEEISEGVTEDAEPNSEPEEVPAKTVSGPSGMSEADKAVFAQLPPELQAWVSKRESETRADYTRKTQEVAEHRKAVSAEREMLAGAMQQYDAILARFTDQEIAPPNPALRNSDPVAFEEQMAAYVHAKHTQEIAQKERAQNARQFKAMQEAQTREYIDQQERALEEMKSPLARSSKDSAKIRKEVFEYGVKSGIPPEVLKQASAIEMSLLHKARLYDAQQAAAKAVKTVPPAAPKVQAPGPAKAMGRPSNLAVAIRNLEANPTRESLAAAYAAQLRAERT